jgi:hypothetical protein
LNVWHGLLTLGEISRASGVDASVLMGMPADLVEELGELAESMRSKDER